ncbi:MAG: hypothetical protein F6K55_35760 [Moorea sp. SIO4A3]|nr:hypothetical protein [Moorena sp. SIO4A3]
MSSVRLVLRIVYSSSVLQRKTCSLSERWLIALNPAKDYLTTNKFPCIELTRRVKVLQFPFYRKVLDKTR